MPMQKNSQIALKELLATYQQRVNVALDKTLPAAHIHPSRLHHALRYSVLDGGKRFRPVLVYATAQALGADLKLADAPACAVELIHAYSLIHDDLPAMDDDDLRRGKPTCHKAFDEATAILAGDALQALAFAVLTQANNGLSNAARISMIDMLANAAGSRGMAGGQAIDLAAVGQSLSVAELEDMHIHKTGALIRASVRMGALCAPPLDDATMHRLDRYAMHMGLAFQVWDDVLDVEAPTAELGKPQGSDEARNKPTYPSLLGLADAKARAQELYQDALKSIEALDTRADPLRWLAEYVVTRGS